MKCINCGNELPENAKYCPICAEPITLQKAFSEAQKISKEKRKYMLSTSLGMNSLLDSGYGFSCY